MIDTKITDEEFERLCKERGYEKVKPKGRQRAGFGKCYWYIRSGFLRIDKTMDMGHEVDACRFAIGNYYYTEEEAEQALAKQLATQRVIDALEIANDGWVVDWSDGEQEKFTLFYDHRRDAFGLNSRWQRQLVQDSNLLGTKEACETVIKSHEADLRLMFGV